MELAEVRDPGDPAGSTFDRKGWRLSNSTLLTYCPWKCTGGYCSPHNQRYTIEVTDTGIVKTSQQSVRLKSLKDLVNTLMFTQGLYIFTITFP